MTVGSVIIEISKQRNAKQATIRRGVERRVSKVISVDIAPYHQSESTVATKAAILTNGQKPKPPAPAKNTHLYF